MPNLEKQDEKCNARVRNYPDDWPEEDGEPVEGYCANKAGFRTSHVGDGKCYLHGGAAVEANKGNTYNESHGLYTNRQPYYENRTDKERNWIDAVVESLLDDMPGGDADPSIAKLEMVRNIAIDMHKERRANEYIDEIGVVHKDKTVGYTDDGRPMKEDVENPLNISYDRLSRNITRNMEKLGILDDPESQKADAQQNIANELSAIRDSRNQN
jgi:hypothetical protein